MLTVVLHACFLSPRLTTQAAATCAACFMIWPSYQLHAHSCYQSCQTSVIHVGIKTDSLALALTEPEPFLLNPSDTQTCALPWDLQGQKPSWPCVSQSIWFGQQEKNTNNKHFFTDMRSSWGYLLLLKSLTKEHQTMLPIFSQNPKT